VVPCPVLEVEVGESGVNHQPPVVVLALKNLRVVENDPSDKKI
jgi:hypothetical protein